MDTTPSHEPVESLPSTPMTVAALKELETTESIENTIVDSAYRRPGDGHDDLVLTFGLLSKSGMLTGIVWDPDSSSYVKISSKAVSEDDQDGIDDVESAVNTWVEENFRTYHIYETEAITRL